MPATAKEKQARAAFIRQQVEELAQEAAAEGLFDDAFISTDEFRSCALAGIRAARLAAIESACED